MEKITFYDKKTGEDLYNIFYDEKNNKTYIIPTQFNDNKRYSVGKGHGYDLFRMFRKICWLNEIGYMGVYRNIKQ